MENNEKTTVDALALMSIFKAIQDEIFRLQPINEFLYDFIRLYSEKCCRAVDCYFFTN